MHGVLFYDELGVLDEDVRFQEAFADPRVALLRVLLLFSQSTLFALKHAIHTSTANIVDIFQGKDMIDMPNGM